MSKEFKVGDKVKCIDAQYSGRKYLTVGQVYRVTEVNEDWGGIKLEGVEHPYEYWNTPRFELAPQEQNEFILKGKDSAGRMFDYASLGSVDECRTYLENHGKAELTYTVTECVPRAVFAVQEEVTRYVTAV